MNTHTTARHINHAMLRTAVAAHSALIAGGTSISHSVKARAATKRVDERGEGVISVALAVLIMAALAAAMWLAYKAMWDDASKRTADIVTKVGA